MYYFVRVIVWISEDNNVKGRMPSELALLTNLEYLWVGKSFLVILLVSLVLRIYSHSLAWMILWILDINALTGPIPLELGLLSELTELYLRKSFLSFYLFHLCYEYTLTCLDDLLDFRLERLDRSHTFGARIALRADYALLV